MTYAILDDAKTSVTKTGSIRELFKNVSFPASGVPDSFLTANNVVELVETLSYTSPSQKLTKVTPYVDSGKAYSVKVETTSADEITVLNTAKWSEIRFARNELLKQTDWRAIRASETGVAMSTEWLDYRKSLRDLPSTQADPFAITWPTEPS